MTQPPFPGSSDEPVDPNDAPTQVPGQDTSWNQPGSDPFAKYDPYAQTGYGYPQPGYGGWPTPAATHSGATTAMVLGIVGLAGAILALACGVTAITLFASPFAWWLGAKSRKEIDAAPGTYRNRGMAVAGFVTGIIGTVLLLISIVIVVVAVVAIIAASTS